MPKFLSGNLVEDKKTGETHFVGGYVTQWETGDFVDDLATPVPAESIPDQLDRIALHHCTGNNFFPGIEAGQNISDPNMYGRPFRLDPTNVGKVFPGCLTEIMALPWQADSSVWGGGCSTGGRPNGPTRS